MIKKSILLILFVIFSVSLVSAKARLPKFFGDSMVLQREQPLPVWGWADAGEKITVQFNKQSRTTKAGKNGRWKVVFDPEKAGGPFQLNVKAQNSITISNILVGEVWLCSGQSNMEWPLKMAKDGVKEAKEANNPMIRHVYITKALSGSPLDDLKESATWKAASPANAGNFTAVGYFFAKELFKELNVPIGLVHSSWGGTDVETWTSREAFQNSEEFKDMINAIPVINLEEMANKKKAELLKKMNDIQGGLPDPSAVTAWKELTFDDSKWMKLNAPGLWEYQSLPDFDGVVWYRKDITLSANESGKEAVLDLAMIDDTDETYVNGVKIGTTDGYTTKRTYNVKGGILKEGKNVISIRITDTGGGGGIYGEASELKITVNGKEQSLAGEWRIGIESVNQVSSSVGPNSYPTLLYNAMINPLIPFAIKGAIWYQGENNTSRATQYRIAFPLMINDWRQKWGIGNFPFYFAQLASFNSNNGTSNKGSNYAELREAQTFTLSLPNTGMAVLTDIGESNDIHPRNKKDVGKRLAAQALNKTYGKITVSDGPIFKKITVDGNKVVLEFSNIGGGLFTSDKYGYLKGFEVAGEDQKFYYAKAFIEGDHVVLTSDSVKTPVAVRYAWADDPNDANLYNKEGFPALPFRTDKWKEFTSGRKYRSN